MDSAPPSTPEYTARVLTSITEVDRADWNALLPAPYNPFLDWDFLHACEASGSAVLETGWAPRHIWVENAAGDAIGAAPLYGKSHSQGEYVFDHGWADALHRAGGEYYPKLQCSIPFTPATGPRLLARTSEHKTAIAGAMLQACDQWGMSGVHLTFLREDDKTILENMGFLIREDRQFHFRNDGYDTFDDFLSDLSSRKRKNIKKERAAAQDGITIERLTGADLKDEHWDAFYQFYLDTGQRKWGRPYFTRDFFARIHADMADKILLVMAYEDDTPIAGALNFIGEDTLFGRNWGAVVHKPYLHFELCYYQAIDAGIEMGLQTVEAGAQGEHKLARGYAPTATYSAHWLSHPGLREAVDDYLNAERRAVEREITILGKHMPFKAKD